jgi:aconitate hydratase
MFLGATNAFTGQAGTGVNPLTGERGHPLATIARALKAAGQPWVVVGDENYGEGSSREHAAMSPRYLGCAAVLVRSFARIHETNLKKQGVLPLTFQDPADYERVEQDDRVSVAGLHALEPGQPVLVRLRKPDGRTVELAARHSMTREQIAWFRAGSALNAGQPVDLRTGETPPMTAAALARGDTKAKPGKDV